MNAESAAFVPSARGRKLSSSMTTVDNHDTFAQPTSISQQPNEAFQSTSSKIPRSTSAHTSSLAETAAGKSANPAHHAPSSTSGNTSSHSRSSSLPGNGSSSSNRGRGASSTRGRGSSSRGRGGARGGNTSTSDRASTHQPKKSADPPSRPPVALDSVDEFPALGGGPLPSKATPAEAHSTATDKDSSPILNKSSPTLSPSQSFKGLSFARVVAPAPPPSAAPSAPSSSATTGSAPSEKKARTSSVSSPSISSHSPPTSNPSSVSEQTRATSPSTSMSPVLGEQGESTTDAAVKGTAQPTTGKKKKKRSSKDQPQPGQQQGQGQNPGQNFAGPSDPGFNMYNGVYAGGGAYEGDPFNVVIPDDAQRPYFEGPLDPSGAPIQQSPQPGLTPVQIAFLAANGFNIEGMPNVSNDAGAGMSVEALQEYYNPPMPPQDVVGVHASSSTNLGKSTSGKKESKKSKKERNQAGHPGFPHQQMNGQNGAPSYGNFDNQQAGQFPYFDAQYYDEQQQQYAQFQQQDQQPQESFDPSYQQSQEHLSNEGDQARPSLTSATANHNGSFHFHPDVASFQPRHFSADAQEFKPKSPLLHVDAPVFVPPQYQEGAEEKAPNGFRSAVDKSREETPKPTPEELPEQTGSPSAEQEVQEEVGTVVEQVQDKVAETIETVKATISNITSNEPAEETKEPEQVQEGSTVVEQVQQQVSETVETVKETISNVTSDEIPAEEQEEKADESSNSGAPEPAQKSDEATAEKESQSPPHSTFSLLPPVTVEDVLDKAQSMADSVKESAQDAVTAVEETVQSVAETVTETFTTSHEAESQEGEDPEQATKDNLDELDIPNDEETSHSSSGVEAHTSQEATANIDELDLPDLKVIDELEHARHAKDSSSTSASDSVAPESSQYSISPSEVEHQLATSTEGESGMPVLQAEIEAIAQTSFAASIVPQFEIISQAEDQCAVMPLPEQKTLEIISTSEDICDVAFEANDTAAGLGPRSPLQIISRSEDQCETEDATRGARSATLDSLASTNSSAAPFIRSSAPSPASRAEDLAPSASAAKPDVPALSIPLSTPPVVISPSTPISPDSGSPIRPSQLSSPKPLSKKWQAHRPEPIRQPSEAEKDAAIRLVRELRSEPSTPILESEDMLAGTSSGTVNASTPGESTESDTFKFDLSGRFSELNSSKRKRGKGDIEEDDEDPDKKERRVDDSGEAPSLTMSIFSGSILPRKQFIVSIFASLGINLFLPFVNGVMLGFGEIFARDWLGPLFGFGRNRSSSTSSNQSFSQSGLGIRGAGNQRGGAQDVPGHAAAKTAIETVAEEIVQAPAKL